MRYILKRKPDFPQENQYSPYKKRLVTTFSSINMREFDSPNLFEGFIVKKNSQKQNFPRNPLNQERIKIIPEEIPLNKENYEEKQNFPRNPLNQERIKIIPEEIPLNKENNEGFHKGKTLMKTPGRDLNEGRNLLRINENFDLEKIHRSFLKGDPLMEKFLKRSLEK
jgi:hypothetical protein